VIHFARRDLALRKKTRVQLAMKPSSSPKRMNFLHYGSALQQAQILQGVPAHYVDKGSLAKTLEDSNSDLGVIVRGYGPKRRRKISIADLQLDFSKTQILQTFFRKLACRGFSHRVEHGIGLNEPLRRSINLRIALMADDSFFYPPVVKQYLRRMENNHYFSHGFPSIAFALGEKKSDGWYVYVLQSDVVGARSALVRQHFRGWRKVLFAHILRDAVENTSKVFLCSASDVLRACRPEFPRPDQALENWMSIYDDTARFFNMERVQASRPINIQIYPDLPAVPADRFYRFAVTDRTKEMVRSLVGGIP
jgi:hypothetical protein